MWGSIAGSAGNDDDISTKIMSTLQVLREAPIGQVGMGGKTPMNRI